MYLLWLLLWFEMAVENMRLGGQVERLCLVQDGAKVLSGYICLVHNVFIWLFSSIVIDWR